MLQILRSSIVLLFFVGMIIFSCTEDEVQDASTLATQEEEEIDSTFSGCDSVFIATFTAGTTCCVSGKIQARPGDVFRYHHQMNYDSVDVEWEVRQGDIIIQSGQDTHTVTVTFGPDFTTGELVGTGTATVLNPFDPTKPYSLVCAERILITNPDGSGE